MMKHIVLIIFTGIITSFFYFPFVFKFFPITNTKNILAGVGIVLFFIRMAQERNNIIQRDFIVLSIGALFISIAGVFSLIYNNTSDYAYAIYIRSMWIWISAAYVVVNMIRWVHSKVSIVLLVNYLLGVCVFQCIIALLIDNFEVVRNAVHTFLPPMDFMEKVNRLYGIGASLDVGGTRFAAVLIMTSYVVSLINSTIYRKYIVWYLIGFIVVAVVGNMIARTTTVGMLLSVPIVVCPWYFIGRNFVFDVTNIWKKIIIIMMIILPIVIYLYNVNDVFRHDIRFAFEGFFSIVEQGEWNVASNNKLKTMYIFPDNFKTWFIGDGYFDNPYYGDYNYIGQNFNGYYKETDVGYLRFIFYFGLCGLTMFILYMCNVCKVCMSKFTTYKWMFIFLLMLNFLIWFKVSTDIFLVFALFLIINTNEEGLMGNIRLKNENSL